MSFDGKFILTLRCDLPNCQHQETIEARNFNAAVHEARKRGWHLSTKNGQKQGWTMCPTSAAQRGGGD